MTSSRPYQSRLLTFLLRQFQKGVARQQYLWRQAKSAALWGVQTALFPAYVLLRTARASGPQLPGAAREWFRRLRPTQTTRLDADQDCGQLQLAATANATIVRVLTAAREWQLQVQSAGSPLARVRRMLQRQPSAPLSIRGIASDLESRSLCLVDRDNHLWSLRTLQQQVLQQIEALIAAYWQQAARTPMLSANVSILSEPAESTMTECCLSTAPHPFISGKFLQRRRRNNKSALSKGVSVKIQSTKQASVQRPSVVAKLHIPLPTAHKAPMLSAATVWDTVVMERKYMMHPLERALRWIDRVLSWIERQFLGLSRWLTTFNEA